MKQCMDADNLHRRLKKIIGQVQAIDRMIDQDIPCEDILAQINAAKSALHGCGRLVLEGHIQHCVRDGLEHGDAEQTIEKLISLWENGEIPAKVSKDVMKKSKVVGDVLELYYEILKLVPPTYFEERKSQKTQVDGEKQIVLSCYLKTGGTR